MTFDHIIVGAGSAGCALAARLSENPARRVLLLEAGGGDRSPILTVPAGIVRAIGNPRYDWAHLAEPDASRGGKVDLWPAGKVLGGSSSINGMLWVRGNHGDFDRWQAAGNPGWGWADVAPLFRRMEDYAGDGDCQWRGRLGPQRVEGLRTTHPMARDFIAAAVAAGLPLNPDYNGETQDGVAAPQVSQQRGSRFSAASAYLAAARRRPNLRIVTRAEVRRVTFGGRWVTGVEWQRHGRVERAAAPEVTLCAGALATPKLLMLSGIGDAAHLGEHGIAVLHHSPQVGRNLAEHPNANMSWDVRPRTYNVEINGARAPFHALNWLLFRRGPATSPYPHAVAFFRTAPDLKVPDIQLMFGPFAFAFSPEGVVPYRKPAVTVVAALNDPRTRGRLTLRSADPAAPPVIAHALLAEEADVARLTLACRRVRTIFEQAALRADVIAERLPGAGVERDDEWADYLRATTFLGYHPCGTAIMGPEGVVDARLRVRGVEGLRVADASIMPSPVSGNTNAASMMIGEKAADLIAEQG